MLDPAVSPVVTLGQHAFLLTALATNTFLATEALVYTLCLAAQLAFYAWAFGGAGAERCRVPLRFLAIPYYFCVVSVAGVRGFVSFVRGQQQTTWEPTGIAS